METKKYTELTVNERINYKSGWDIAIAYEGQKVNTPPLFVNIIGLVLFLAGTILCSIFGYLQFETTKGCNLLVVSLISIFGLINVKAYFTYLIINRIKQKDIYKIIK